jgi:lipoprotein-anchoring transpeptidase ErfK/SrfK
MLNISKRNLVVILFTLLIATILLISGLFVYSLKNQGFNDLQILKQNQSITTGLNNKYLDGYKKVNEGFEKEINSSYFPWTLQNIISKIFNTNKSTIETYTGEVANVKAEFLQSLEAWKTGISSNQEFDGKVQALKDIQLLTDNVKTIITAKDLEAQKAEFQKLQATYQLQLDVYNKKAFLVGVKGAENDVNDLTDYLRKYPELSSALSNVEKYKTEILNISNEESLKKMSYQDLENKVNNDIRPLLASAFNSKAENEELIRLRTQPASTTASTSNTKAPISRGKLILVKKGEQKMYIYNDGQLLRETSVTTGRIGWPTDTGTFSILTKERSRRLKGSGQGATWDVFVNYWMLFNAGDEEGIHDAPWRNGIFGNPLTESNGSRGCVNTPDDTISWLFDWANIGTPVFVQD